MMPHGSQPEIVRVHLAVADALSSSGLPKGIASALLDALTVDVQLDTIVLSVGTLQPSTSFTAVDDSPDVLGVASAFISLVVDELKERAGRSGLSIDQVVARDL